MAEFAFNIWCWYFLAQDGRVFSMSSMSEIDPDDADYTDWLAAGREPMPWPGDETKAAIDDVLTRI